MFKKFKINLKNYIHHTYFDKYRYVKLIFMLLISSMVGLEMAFLGTGLPKVLDFIVFTAATFLGLIILIVILQLVSLIIKKIPIKNLPFIIGLFIISYIFVTNFFIDTSFEADVFIAITIGIIQLIFIYSILKLLSKNKKNGFIWSIFIFSLFINISMIYFIGFKGYDENLTEKYLSLRVENNNDSSIFSELIKKGDYSIKKLSYGSSDKYNLKTSKVNLSPYVSDEEGIIGKLRNIYWGFDSYSVPITGDVFFPEKGEKLPLILIAHGNHTMTTPSHEGYEYLANHLVSKGYVVASINENFLNFYINSNLADENDARAIMMLNNIKEFEKFNNDKENPLYNKIDMNNIALVGHSRGGEAVAIAALFNKLSYYPDDGDIKLNFNYNIKSIASIAPTYNQYKPSGKSVELENINYFSVHGSYDQDVTEFDGREQYDNVKFTDGKDYFKSYLYIYGANHGQFNSTWGRYDLNKPMGWFLNTKPIIKDEDQKSILKGYLTGFFDCTLKNKNEYKDMFINYKNIQNDLPRTVYVNEYEDSNFKVIANYEEDLDLKTSSLKNSSIFGKNFTIWREEKVRRRDGSSTRNTAVRLRWYKGSGSFYSISLPENDIYLENINNNSILQFSACRMDNYDVIKNEFNDVDFTIQLEDVNGNISSLLLKDYYTLYPPLRSNLYKNNFLVKNNTIEHELQNFTFPIEEFVKNNSKLNIKKLKTIKFVFDKGVKGDILLDNIGVCI